MAKISQNYRQLAGAYLFPEITRRVNKFSAENPGIEIMRLGIGNTTEPLPEAVVWFLKESATCLGTDIPYNEESLDLLSMHRERVLHQAKYDKYTGYGDEQGNGFLRTALSRWYGTKGIKLDPSEIFISDGAKTDSANIGSIFHQNSIIAVEDPSYPVPVDSNVIAGRTGRFNDKTGHYDGIVYMPCTAENGFFPEVPKEKVDLIYMIRPNNPTGAVATKEQLQRFVDYAIANNAVIIFDAAYSAFISDPNLPKSIYDVKGAEKCAIEINSFSKWAGFTGIRAGWTVVPKGLSVEDSKDGEINAMWNRRQTTMFNGASLIAQAGALGVLTEAGQKQCQKIIDFYMANAGIIKDGLKGIDLKVFGGEHAPFVWAQTPNGMDSWAFFDKLLKDAHVVCTPGGGFGPCGNQYARFSAFGNKATIERAIESIQNNLRC